PIGVMNGGKLTQPYRKLRVVGLPGDLPDSIILNVDELRIGDSIRVEDIKLNGVTFREAASAVVLGVKMARGAVDEDEEEETEGEEGTEEGAETSAEEGAES
ncbi:MAG: 50S ribosomal protein L25, partial [Flavobacteriales bacterium]